MSAAILSLSEHGARHAPRRMLPGGSSHPVLLDEPSLCLMLRAGTVDVFAIVDSALDSRRRYLFTLAAGDALFGLSRLPQPHVGLVAVGSLGSEMEIVGAGERLPAAACDGWIRALSATVGATPSKEQAVALAVGTQLCPAGAILRGSAREVLWASIEQGHGVLLPAATPVAAGSRFPLVGALEVAAATDLHVAASPAGLLGPADLALFNRACQTALGTQALGTKALGRSAPDGAPGRRAPFGSPLHATLRDLAGAARSTATRFGAASAHDPAAEPLQAAVERVFAALDVRPQPRAFERGADGEAPAAERLAAILATHRFPSRTVLLRPGWTGSEGPPLLGWLDEERRPVALVHRRGWRAHHDGRALAIDASFAARLAPDAVQIYPVLPPEPFGFGALVRFGLAGGGLDRWRLAGCLLASAVFAAAIPFASRTLINDVLPHGEFGTAGLLVAGLFVAVLARTAFETVKALVLLRSELRVEGRLQPALLARMMALPTSFYRAHAVGDIMDRVLGVQRARQLLTQHGGGAIVGAVFSLVSLLPIVLIDAELALVTLALALLLGGATAAISGGELRHERRRTAGKGRLDAFVLQLLMGMAKLRSSAAEAMAFQRWAVRFRDVQGHEMAARRWANLQHAAQSLLPELATIALYAVILGAIGSQMAKPGTDAFSAGDFVALSAAAAQVFGAIAALADALTRTLAAVPLIERAQPIIATALDLPAVEPQRLALAGDIDIRGVSFRYAPKAPLALDRLDLRIRRGEFVAIVGASGSGKSTLLRLLLGFETPDAGDIFYDGCSIRRLAVSDLRRQMGVVLQHGRLSAGSIHGNIVGQSGLGMEEAVAAARMVGLDRDIAGMPMGMHTVLLDGAPALSGGQRQRILLARALIGRPAIVLLDEATSALDNRTQAVVTETLASLAVTRVAIAHRLSTIQAADRIVVIDKGRVVETGDYPSLMARDGLFAAHARRQLA